MANLAVAPYFDDFSESKNFHQILFKSGFAVQGRELTQLQSILQNQIARFGSHIFKDGSMVVGGNVRLNNQIYSVDVDTFAVSVFGDFSDSWYAVYGSSVYRVMYAEDATVSSATKLYLQKEYGTVPALGTAVEIYNSDNYVLLMDGDAATEGSPSVTCSTLTATTQCSLAAVDAGVTYINGRFVHNSAQVIPVGSNPATTVVGFDVVESFVDASQDLSLLDPSQGTPNYAAPGADRLMIELKLTTRPWDGKNDLQASTTSFVELMRLLNGVVQDDRRVPIYSDIGDTLARRTFDESGNYITKPFGGTFDTGNQSDANLTLTIGSGKAYVRGYEIEKISSRDVTIRKARDVETTVGEDISCPIGNYTIVTNVDIADAANLNTLFNITSPTQVKLFNTGGTQIGTAFTIALEHSGIATKYRLYLFEVSMTSGSFGDVRSFVTGTWATPTCKMLVDSSAIVGGIAQLYDTAIDTSVFPFPQPWIANIDSFDYYTRRMFPNNISSTNSFTIASRNGKERFAGGASSAVASGDVNALYTVYDRTSGLILDMTTGSRSVFVNASVPGQPGTASINLTPGELTGHTFDVVATIDITGEQIKTKTLSFTTATKTTAAANTTYSLGKVDVKSVRVFATSGLQAKAITFTVSGTTATVTCAAHGFTNGDSVYCVFDSQLDKNAVFVIAGVTTNTFTITVDQITTGTGTVYKGTDLTSSFTFDDGQRDMFYDYSTIKSGATIPADFTSLITYFAHNNSGAAFTLNSYTNIAYYDIPAYTTKRTSVTNQLRDCLDFRIDRADTLAHGTIYTAPGSSAFTGAVSRIPSTQFYSIINSSYSYYTSRVDTVFLMSDGTFKVVEGTPAYLFPNPPSDLPNGMSVFQVRVGAYTNTDADVLVKQMNHRVYTMADIGKLDKRITALEYYAQLSLLEEETANKNIYDSVGGSIFKNGFLVDSFVSNQVVDLTNPEYKAAINNIKKILQPKVSVSKVEFSWDATSTAQQYGPIALIPPSSEEIFLTQPMASHVQNVNPYTVIRPPGYLKLTPSIDTWQDMVQVPTTTVVDGTVTTNNYVGGTLQGWGWSAGQETLASTSTSEQQTEIDRQITSTVVDIAWMRSKTIQFEISGMKPNTRLYLAFDGVNISDTMTPPELVTNAGGYCTGSFVLPCDAARRFASGSKMVFFADITRLQDYNHDTTYCSAAYTSAGTQRTDDIRITMRRDTTITRSWNAVPVAFGGAYNGFGGGASFGFYDSFGGGGGGFGSVGNDCSTNQTANSMQCGPGGDAGGGPDCGSGGGGGGGGCGE